jgi:hypothetical protein
VIIVDDHLALLAIAGRLPDLGGGTGPVATTYAFQFRLARALTTSSSSGALTARVVDPLTAVRRVLHPPANRLTVLDPRRSLDQAIAVSGRHRANLLLAELVGAAVQLDASVRVTAPNVGPRWPAVMAAEGVDFATVDA